MKKLLLPSALITAAIAIGLTLAPSALFAQNMTNSTTSNSTASNSTTPTTGNNQTTSSNDENTTCTCNNNSTGGGNNNQTTVVVPPANNSTVVIPPVTPTNETKDKPMLLSISPDRAVIDRGSTQKITITASSDNGTGIPDAKVTAVTLNYASGSNKTLSAGSTDQNGQFVIVTKIGGHSQPGQFNVIASAKKDGYVDAKAVSGFVVNPKSK